MQYMVVDILTKVLAKDRHELLNEMMGLRYNVTLQNGSIEFKKIHLLSPTVVLGCTGDIVHIGFQC